MDYRKLVIDSCVRLYDSNLTVGTWGNISIRDPDTGYVYITPSGMDYYSCLPEDINLYKPDGTLVEGFRTPSIEKNLHLSIYRARPDVGGVIHAHPLYSSVFGVLEEDIPAVTEEFAQLIGKKVCCSRYALPGTDELAGAVVDALGAGAAVILPNHGTVCVGKDIESAFAIAEVLEKACHIYHLARSLGKPRIVSDEHVEIMYDFRNNIYGQRE